MYGGIHNGNGRGGYKNDSRAFAHRKRSGAELPRKKGGDNQSRKVYKSAR